VLSRYNLLEGNFNGKRTSSLGVRARLLRHLAAVSTLKRAATGHGNEVEYSSSPGRPTAFPGKGIAYAGHTYKYSYLDGLARASPYFR